MTGYGLATVIYLKITARMKDKLRFPPLKLLTSALLQ